MPFSTVGIILTTLVLTATRVAHASRLIVAGDSWGAYGGNDLQVVLTEHGSNLTVSNFAIGGTTAEFWSRIPNFLSDLVDEYPDTEYIWLSIGGNDVIDYMSICTLTNGIDTCVNEILPITLTNTRSFLDPLFKNHPTVKVIQFGYDIVNFQMNGFCKILGTDILHGCLDRPSCINPQMVKIQYLYVNNLTMYYDNHFALDLLGSLQTAGGIPYAYLTHPNLDEWSPADLMMSNCIHPTTGDNGGFQIIFNNMWDVFFANQR